MTKSLFSVKKKIIRNLVKKEGADMNTIYTAIKDAYTETTIGNIHLILNSMIKNNTIEEKDKKYYLK